MVLLMIKMNNQIEISFSKYNELYNIGYAPEETKLIDSCLLTEFRRERLIDNDINLMDKLIEKTVKLALEKDL